ncbi:Sulfate transporter (plasmid) [Ralstonia solanacearum]|nr:Sulfate transporter [Ralstonia solanacearum]
MLQSGIQLAETNINQTFEPAGSGIQLAETNINQTFEPAGWRSLPCRKQTPNNLSPIDYPD